MAKCDRDLKELARQDRDKDKNAPPPPTVKSWPRARALTWALEVCGLTDQLALDAEEQDEDVAKLQNWGISGIGLVALANRSSSAMQVQIERLRLSMNSELALTDAIKRGNYLDEAVAAK